MNDVNALVDSYIRPNTDPDRKPGENYVAIMPFTPGRAWFPCRHSFETAEQARAEIRRLASLSVG